ncbi:MAG: protein-tyrosine phosphatase family protein [Alphaproteobacteria bacterium]
MSLIIATVSVSGGGRIGVCGLPGLTGDLEGDLLAITGFDPALVVSMTEAAEMEALGAGNLGQRLQHLGIDWVHLPIRDFSGLAPEHEDRWPDLSRRLHDLLDDEKSILLHCRAGRGRSGMIALRLMVERGEDATNALRRLRDKRPGAVETPEQRLWAVTREGENTN